MFFSLPRGFWRRGRSCCRRLAAGVAESARGGGNDGRAVRHVAAQVQMARRSDAAIVRRQKKRQPPRREKGAGAAVEGRKSGRKAQAVKVARVPPIVSPSGVVPKVGAAGCRAAQTYRFTTRAERMRTSSSGRSLASVATRCIVSITSRPFTTSPNTVY